MTTEYSIQKMVSDGTLSTIALGIQYLQRNDIYMRVAGEETPQSGAPSGYTWSFLDNTTLKILPVVPNGVEVVVYRRTDVDAMYNIYSQNAQFDEATIDENNQQLLYIAQEYLEQGLPGAGVESVELVREDGALLYYRIKLTDGAYTPEFIVPRVTAYVPTPAQFTFASGGTLAIGDSGLSVLWPVVGGGDEQYYVWKGAYPKTIPASSSPSSTGGVSASGWLPIGDITLRSDLASSESGKGRNLVYDAASAVDVAALEVKTDRFATPEQFLSLVVSGDWTAAINAAFATGLPVLLSDTYTVSGIINSRGQRILGKGVFNTSRYSLGSVNAETVQPDSASIRMLYVESAYDLTELLYIKSLGFNTINHYCYFESNGTIDSAGTAEQLLNNALTAGLKVNLGTESPRALANLAEFVNATKDHSATWGYSVYDEPASRGISIATQDAKIATLRGITTHQLSFVDLVHLGAPFAKRWSANYDLAFVDSYSLHYATGTQEQWLSNDLKKMRFDYGTIKAHTGLSRVIPVISAFTYAGGLYSANESQVIAASNVFGTIAEGSFGAFVWDGIGDANITGRVRSNANFRALVKGLASQPVRKKKETEVYIFGGTPADGHWPLTSLIEKIPQKDVSTTDPYPIVSSYPVRLISGVSDTDRITTIPSSDYGGIGFKGAQASFLTTIKARQNTRCFMECFNVIGETSGAFNLFTTNDGGYTIVLRYEDALSGNKVLDFNIAMTAPDDHIVFRIENAGDYYPYYRKFLRGLVVCCDW